MDTPLSLLGSLHQNQIIQHVSDYMDTTHWPSVLSTAIEELLIKQVIHTVNEVTKVVLNEGYVLEELIIEAEKLF